MSHVRAASRTLAAVLLAASMSGPVRVGEARAGAPEDYRAEIQTLCNAEKLSGARREKDPARRAVVIASFLSQQGGGPKLQAFFNSLAGMSACDKPSRILDEARNNGIAQCPFAEAALMDSDDACGPIGSLKDEIALLCRAEQLLGAAKEKDANARYMKVYTFYLNRRTSPEFGRMFVELHESYPCDRAAMLEARAKAAGISRCDLAASWRRDFCAAKK